VSAAFRSLVSLAFAAAIVRHCRFPTESGPPQVCRRGDRRRGDFGMIDGISRALGGFLDMAVAERETI
jgi:hypothetical protein